MSSVLLVFSSLFISAHCLVIQTCPNVIPNIDPSMPTTMTNSSNCFLYDGNITSSVSPHHCCHNETSDQIVEYRNKCFAFCNWGFASLEFCGACCTNDTVPCGTGQPWEFCHRVTASQGFCHNKIPCEITLLRDDCIPEYGCDYTGDPTSVCKAYNVSVPDPPGPLNDVELSCHQCEEGTPTTTASDITSTASTASSTESTASTSSSTESTASTSSTILVTGTSVQGSSASVNKTSYFTAFCFVVMYFSFFC